MTVTFTELAVYAGALLVLFLTPGPVWLALSARALSGGFQAAWPLALGVVVGDLLWPVLAIFGLALVVQSFDGVVVALRFIASGVFIVMGLLLIRHAADAVSTDSRLTRPGRWAGFTAGLAAILGNPKAILFYMGVLPGFFDLSRVTPFDIAAIAGMSMLVPLLGNLALAAAIARARARITRPDRITRINQGSGVALILVGVGLPFL